jgi:hypothetical protein
MKHEFLKLKTKRQNKKAQIMVVLTISFVLVH